MRILPFLILLSGIHVLAQKPVRHAAVKGLVLDSSNNSPMSFATIVLADSIMGHSILTDVTKMDGSLEISVPVDEPYKLDLA